MTCRTGKRARQFIVELIKGGANLAKQADAFGRVLAKLWQSVTPASREPVYLRRQRIGAGEGTVTISDACARCGQLAAEPGEIRDQVIKYLTGQVKISTHRPALDAIV